MVKPLLARIEHRLLEAPNTVSLERAELVTQAYSEHADEPPAVRRAKALRHVLRNMTLDLRTNPVFAGNTSPQPRAWMLVPEAGFKVDPQIALEHPDLANILDEAIPEQIAEFWRNRSAGRGAAGVGHFCPDYDKLVNEGLEAVISAIESSRGDERSRMYREAMHIACRAVIEWAGRYAEAAEAAASRCDDAEVGSCLRRIAATCRHVPARPARNLFEGLQSILLVHLAMYIEGQGMSVSIGLPDRVLERFAKEAEADPDAAADLTAAFILAISANSFQGRGSKTQAITIGGAGCDRQDKANAVTFAFLNAFGRCRSVGDPHLFVRWHGRRDEQLWTASMEMLSSGRSMPLLVNDEAVVPGLLKMKVAPADAWEYCIIGCNELGIPGRCCQSAFPLSMVLNELDILESLLRKRGSSFACLEDVLEAYEHEVHKCISDAWGKRRQRIDELVEDLPMPFSSACCQGTVEAGDDLLRAMPYQNTPCTYVRGTANAANALNVLSQEVFTDQGCSLEKLRSRVDSRDPATLRRIAGADKWGRDDDQQDASMIALCRRRTLALERFRLENGLDGAPVCHVIRSLHHLNGRRMGPTLDGRDAGEPLGDSIGPVAGTNREGPTAALNSVLKLEAPKHFAGIYNLNITLSGTQGRADVISALSDAFFADGGQELQLNVLDADLLRSAMADPRRYRDLVVRVAGLNARFVELSPAEQQELIDRAEQAASTARPGVSA